MKKGIVETGKWHFKFGIVPVYWRDHGFLFNFGIFKLLDFPPLGEMISKKHYKGFWFRKEFSPEGFEINI